MVKAGVTRLLILLASGLWFEPADAVVKLSARADAPGASNYEIDGSDLYIPFFLINGSGNPSVTVTIGLTPLIRNDGLVCDAEDQAKDSDTEGGAPCRVSWYRKIGERLEQLPFADAVPISLPQGGAAELVLKGQIKETGIYSTSVPVTEPPSSSSELATGKKPTTSTTYLRVTRKMPSLSSKTLEITSNGQGILHSHNKRPATVNIYNTTDRVLDLGLAITSVKVLHYDDVYRGIKADKSILCDAKDGSPPATTTLAKAAESATKAQTAEVATAFTKPDGAVRATLPIGGHMECDIAIGEYGPGRYKVGLLATAPGGAGLRSEVEFSQRLPFWVAFLIILTSAVIGAAIADFRANGRRRILQTADAQDLLRELQTYQRGLAAASPKTQALPDILSKTRKELEQSITKLTTQRAADENAPLMRIDNVLDIIEQLIPLEKRFDRLGADKAPPPVITARKAILNELGKVEVTMATARPLISAYEDELAVAEEERAKQPKKLGGPATDEAGGPVTIVPVRRSSSWLRAYVRSVDNAIWGISILLACIIGILMLWAQNPAWGSLRDIVVALATGAGLTIAGGFSLQSLVSVYGIPKL